jgi:glycosyltransferase involved in cell wall biosynthesis
MKLSIVVPTHGRRDLLERTLTSLASQEGAPPFEVIVVDDGVDPALAEHVRGLGLPLDVRVVHHAENRGRAASRNTGIAHATGDVVVFLDGDMEVVPGFAAAHARAHDAPDRVVLGNIFTAPEIGRSAFVEYTDSRGVKKVGDSEDIPIRYFMTGNSSVSAGLLRRAGGFDEEFDEYGGEDTEMGYRLAAHGGTFRHAKGAVSHHLHLNTVPEMAARLRRYGETMLPILVRKVPRSRKELRLHLAEDVSWRADSAATLAGKALFRVLARRAFWAPAARVAQALPRRLRCDAFFDLIRACAYLDGYRRSLGRRG